MGLAGLGVIIFRSVNQRKQQIGMLRSLGFSKAMIFYVFIAESSLISIFGISIGAFTGMISAQNFLTEFADETSDFNVITPHNEILIFCLLIYLACILFTLAPSLIASRLSPVEATNYPE